MRPRHFGNGGVLDPVAGGNGLQRDLQDRLGILAPRDYEEWLTPTERPPVHLLRVLPAEDTELRLLNPASVEPPCEQPKMKGLFD